MLLSYIMIYVNALEVMKSQTDVREIFTALEASQEFDMPKDCRQRQALNANGRNDVSEIYSIPSIIQNGERHGHGCSMGP